MVKHFRTASGKEVGDNWLIASIGTDELGVNHYVTTHQINASRLYLFSEGAKEDAELIAKLLNWYYSNKDGAENIMLEDE